eukprot:COSAG06_NODE_491_length_15081_cov_9.093245_17_plen_75_part_00
MRTTVSRGVGRLGRGSRPAAPYRKNTQSRHSIAFADVCPEPVLANDRFFNQIRKLRFKRVSLRTPRGRARTCPR